MPVLLQITRESPLSSFNRYRALVLDTSYRPIDIVNWQRAICLDLFDKVRAQQEEHQCEMLTSM